MEVNHLLFTCYKLYYTFFTSQFHQIPKLARRRVFNKWRSSYEPAYLVIYYCFRSFALQLSAPLCVLCGHTAGSQLKCPRVSSCALCA